MKIKRLCSSLLAGITLFATSGFVGCDLQPTNGTSETTTIKVRDFEVYNPDFMSLQMNKYFGKIEENTDKTYVSSGEKSAKFTLLGDEIYTGPNVFVPFYSTYANYNYKDLREIDKVVMSMYNAEEFDMPIQINFEFFDGTETTYQAFTLKSGWNEIEVAFDLDALNLFLNVNDCSGFNISFENYALEGYTLEECPVCYLDDVRLVGRKSVWVEKDCIVLDPYEICGFEKLYQSGVIITKYEDPAKALVASIIGEENGIVPTEGNKMLKLTFENGSSGWPRFYLSDKLMEKVKLSQYKENVDDYYFAYSVYNATGLRTKISTGYYFLGGRGYAYAEDNYISTDCWTEYYISLRTLSEKCLTEIGDNYRFFIQFDSNLPAGSTYYFDNFRIVKK